MNQKEIRATFDYNPETGDLIRRSLNKITGTQDHTGYKRTKYKGKTITCHRLIYIWYHGHIPPHYHIDHKDHNRSNNRIENLQAISPLENSRKKKNNSHNNTVYKVKDGWIAKITIKRKYNTEKEALDAVSIYSGV